MAHVLVLYPAAAMTAKSTGKVRHTLGATLFPHYRFCLCLLHFEPDSVYHLLVSLSIVSSHDASSVCASSEVLHL